MAGPTTTPYVTLNSGYNMPVLGLGTFALFQPPDLVPIFIRAIKLGYRHFDTSPVYGSERPLGFAIAEAIKQGLIQSRDEVFITSKLWCIDTDPQLVLPAVQNSLS
jgi:3''-deamino-3''-oxonicotianamine reductase